MFFEGGFQYKTVTDDVIGDAKKNLIISVDIGDLFVLKKSTTPVMMTPAI